MAATDEVVTRHNTKEGWFRYRYVMTFLLFFAFVACYSHRMALSIAIVPMTNKTSANEDFDDFDWDSPTRNAILSSFFWGYVVCQVPSGLFAQALGAHYVLLGGIAVSSLLTLLTPLAASSGGYRAMYAVRVLSGFAQAALAPSTHAVLSKWVLPEERGIMASIAFSGSQFGTIITLSVGGVLASSTGGWPSIFYAFGGLGVAWCIAWAIFSSSYPADSRFISYREKNIIERELARVGQTVPFRTPWRALFTSIPMWAVIIGHSCQNWGYWTLMTEIPSYMATVLKFDIKSNGFLSALPYLVMALISYAFGYVNDILARKELLSVKWCRRVFNTIGFWGPAAALAALGYMTKNESTLAVAILVVGVGLNAGVYVGFQINHIDLAPNFASTMMGITSCVSSIFSIIGPLVVGFVVVDEGSVSQWRIIFWIAAVVYFFGNIVYCLMSDGVLQPWNGTDPAVGSEQPDEKTQLKLPGSPEVQSIGSEVRTSI